MRENAKNKRYSFAMVNMVLRRPVECHRPKERQVPHFRPPVPSPANLARPARGPPPPNGDSWQARPRARAGDRRRRACLGAVRALETSRGRQGERNAARTRPARPPPPRGRPTGSSLAPCGGGELRSTRNGARDEEEDGGRGKGASSTEDEPAASARRATGPPLLAPLSPFEGSPPRRSPRTATGGGARRPCLASAALLLLVWQRPDARRRDVGFLGCRLGALARPVPLDAD